MATKAHLPMGEDPNMGGNSRRWIVRALEGSLRRLGTDHVDLLQMHRPDADTDVEETLSVLTDLVREGKVRAFGGSSYPASAIVEAQWVAERRGLHRFRAEQPPYSILTRGIEREVLPATQRYGMGTLVWSPLAGGLLTGNYRKGEDAGTFRSRFGFQHLQDERRLDAVERLIPVAQEAGLSLTHMAMAFAIAHPGVTSAIIGPRTMEHLDGLLEGRRGRAGRRRAGRDRRGRRPGHGRRAPRHGLRAAGRHAAPPAPPAGRRARRERARGRRRGLRPAAGSVGAMEEENPRGFDVNLQYPAQAAEYDAIADRVAADRAQRPAGPVLDWGCGWGQVSRRLVDRGLEVRSFDYGPETPDAEVPLERYPELTAFLSSDPVRLPYADGTFGAVLSCGVLEHVRSPPDSLDELHRVLAPGGRLYVYKLPNRLSYLELIAKRSGGRMYFHGQLPDDTIYTVERTRKLLDLHGFDVLESRLANVLPLTAGGGVARRHGEALWRANVALARLPGLRQLATNVEAVAVRR